MSDFTFASAPSVSIPRTKFNRTFSHNASFNLGELVVLGIDEIIPGSTHKVDLGSLIRMSTPIAPIMDDIQFDIYAFLVPLRLTWENWKRFMGENTNGAGAINGINSDKTIPMFITKGSFLNSHADDLGIPAYASGNNPFSVSILPFRGLAAIYNRWFRNQNVESPIPYSLGDSTTGDGALMIAGLTDYNGSLPSGVLSSDRTKAYKLPDYFTSALPYAQKGDPVNIFSNSNARARVLPGAIEHSTTGNSYPLKFRNTSAGTVSGGPLGISTGSTATGAGSFSGVTTVYPSNLYAELSNSVNTTINDLRFAFQLQKFLEKDALYGSRYWEILHAHYAVTSPDATLQDPQLLGHIKFDINIQQVLQTTGFTDPTNTNLGTPGANSVTGRQGHLCTYSAVEHCYVYYIGVARQKRHTYTQGLNKLWTRSARTDFYFPVFANLGAQKVYNREIDVQAGTGTGTFGYQEAWAEYRFLPSYNSGLLNPMRPNSLDYWTLADKYAATPTLSKSFLQESRDNLIRCLVTGATGPDFIGSFYFKDTCVNPMPLYSIPGFADHH